MKSIRLFLIIIILSTITLMVFLSALSGYRDSMTMAEQLFDSKLVNKADIISMMFSAPHPEAQETKHIIATSDMYSFQIWQDSLLLSHSLNTPKSPIAHFKPGFQDGNFLNHRWRIYSVYNQISNVWVFTAERMDIRYDLAENIILEAVVPVVIMIPILGILIWTIVSYGLLPLKKLATELSTKRADDLSPLSIEKQPVELIQVVNSTNDLLLRLKSSFLREKRFAADAAHELRTPISAIKVHLYNLSKIIPADEHSLMQLNLAVDRMGHLVEQILNLNHTAPEHYISRFTTTDIYDLAQEIIIREHRSFEEKNLQLALQGEHCNIEGEPHALDILLQNLLTNACKYTPQDGSVLVSISCNARTVQLQVEDSGPGVAKEQYNRLFDRFYRLDGDCHKSGTTGCGLGLAIVQQIVDLHHATIKLAQSSLAGGLLVTVVFPIEQK